MTVMVGTPRVTMHLEAETEACICPRLSGCGGIESAELYCPEHGVNADNLINARFHTHPAQARRITRGRHL